MNTSADHYESIDAYIDAHPEVADRLSAIRSIVQEEAPEAVEAIKYGMPCFVLSGNMVLFSAFKHHVSVYASTTEMEAALPELKPHLSGSGTIQFSSDEPLPLELIRKVIVFRVKEYRAKN